MHLRWFDYWLKGMDNGIMDEAPVRIFVMGDNVWRDEQEWPLARAQPVDYYLHSRGKANSLRGNGSLSAEAPGSEPADVFLYNPADPVPTRAADLRVAIPTFCQAGPSSRRAWRSERTCWCTRRLPWSETLRSQDRSQ